MGGMLLIGLVFLAHGILVIKRKRCGSEEGLRIASAIKGKAAIIYGIVFAVVGIILSIFGFISLLNK